MEQACLTRNDLLRQLFEGVWIICGVLVARHECIEAAVRRIADTQIVPPINRLFVQSLQLVFGRRHRVRRLWQ